MPSIPPILTESSPKKHLPILMLKGPCFHKPCNSNLQAGPIIVLLLVLGTREEAQRIPHLWEAYSSEVALKARGDMSDDDKYAHEACSAKFYLRVWLELRQVEQRAEHAICKAMNIRSSSIAVQPATKAFYRSVNVFRGRLILGTIWSVMAYAIMTDSSCGSARNNADTSTMIVQGGGTLLIRSVESGATYDNDFSTGLLYSLCVLAMPGNLSL